MGTNRQPQRDKARESVLPTLSPRRVPESWTGQRFHLDRYKEVFDAEPHATLRAMEIFSERRETGVDYTIFSDFMAAIERVLTDRTGPGQA